MYHLGLCEAEMKHMIRKTDLFNQNYHLNIKQNQSDIKSFNLDCSHKFK